MAKLLRLTRCPYCKRKISFFGAAILKTEGEYCCTRCKCTSNVVINKSIYGIASFVCVLSMLTMVLYLSFGNHGDPKGILYVLAPFLIFYILVPFFVRLEPYAVKNKNIPEKKPKSKQPVKTVPEPGVKIRETPQNKQDTIVLDVGDTFKDIFNNAKNDTIKFSEEVSDEQIELEEISSISEEKKDISSEVSEEPKENE